MKSILIFFGASIILYKFDFLDKIKLFFFPINLRRRIKFSNVDDVMTFDNTYSLLNKEELWYQSQDYESFYYLHFKNSSTAL